MVLDATARRRWFGALVLLAALGMLVAGETILKGKLEYLGFLFYWLGCLGFTFLAIVIAILDARALRRETRTAQHDLFQATLKQIEAEAKARKDRPGHKPRGSKP
jgi:membrane protein implicated in regulation of membrane protease activity